MMGALTFASPWLLLGLLAAAIPIVLHLLSSVRAPQMAFPTLRFLRISMEKTARRRKLEHWLLLLVRSLLLGMLALAVAEPILKGKTGFWADKRFAAAIIIDNSYSMAARGSGATRRGRAIAEAGKLLEGEAKPVAASLMFTNGSAGAVELTTDFARLREALSQSRLASGRAPIADRIKAAAEKLADDPASQKAIYVFTDLQKISFEDLESLPELKKAAIPLMIVDCSGAEAGNVGVADLQMVGRRVVGQPVTFVATLVNSAGGDRVVNVFLQVDGHQVGDSIRVVLPSAGQTAASVPVRFPVHRFAAAGTHTGRVAIEEDDALPNDNVRRFSVEVGERVNALVVRGDGEPAGDLERIRMLMLALDPDDGADPAWSVRRKLIPLAELTPAALAGAGAVFFADVPSFTGEQADRVQAFVRAGGAAMFFLGPDVNPANYTDVFVQRLPAFGGLLPGRIERAVGQVGTSAGAALCRQNLQHRYLAGLYETAGDYPDVLVQRHYRFGGNIATAEAVLTTPAGDRILAAKNYGDGRVAVLATTASVEWNNLPTTALLLPIVERICLEAGERSTGDQSYPAGAAVRIRPRATLPEKAAVNVSTPDGTVEALPLTKDGPQHAVVFRKTDQLGEYRWQVVGAGPETPGAAGTFVTNMDGVETDLQPTTPAAIAGVVGPADVYCAKSLHAVNALATKEAGGDRLWDRVIALVILLLVIEAVIANLFRRGAEPVPAHLNPALAD